MYEVWPKRRASAITCASRRPDMITTSTSARWHASSIRDWRREKLPSASRNNDPWCPSSVPSRSVYTQRRATAAHGTRTRRSQPRSAAGPLILTAMTRGRLADRVIELPPPLAAGIVNGTADSFFEGARSETPEQAVKDGLALFAEGFDLLDVGAVPAASGAPVSDEEEAARLIPAIEGLCREARVPLSADTFQPEVARQALDAGAVAINDTSGGLPDMLDLVGQRGCGYVLMHIE